MIRTYEGFLLTMRNGFTGRAQEIQDVSEYAHPCSEKEPDSFQFWSQDAKKILTSLPWWRRCISMFIGKARVETHAKKYFVGSIIWGETQAGNEILFEVHLDNRFPDQPKIEKVEIVY